MELKSLLSYIVTCLFFAAIACKQKSAGEDVTQKELPDQFLVVLGIAQDAGYPQAGCEKECCDAYYSGKEDKKLVTCLALVDTKTHQYWLIEATPDLREQLIKLQMTWGVDSMYAPAGIFIFLAHFCDFTRFL